MVPRHQLIPDPALGVAANLPQRQTFHGSGTPRNPDRVRHCSPKPPRRSPATPVARLRKRNMAGRLQAPKRLDAARLLQSAKRIPEAKHLADPAAQRPATRKLLRRQQRTHPGNPRRAIQRRMDPMLFVHASSMHANPTCD